jgi:hypothetical protein
MRQPVAFATHTDLCAETGRDYETVKVKKQQVVAALLHDYRSRKRLTPLFPSAKVR